MKSATVFACSVLCAAVLAVAHTTAASPREPVPCTTTAYRWTGFRPLSALQPSFPTGVDVPAAAPNETMTVTSIIYRAFDGNSPGAAPTRAQQAQQFEQFAVTIGTADVHQLSTDLPDSVDDGAASSNYSGLISGEFSEWAGVTITGGSIEFRHSSLYGKDDGSTSSLLVYSVVVNVAVCVNDTPDPTTPPPVTDVSTTVETTTPETTTPETTTPSTCDTLPPTTTTPPSTTGDPETTLVETSEPDTSGPDESTPDTGPNDTDPPATDPPNTDPLTTDPPSTDPPPTSVPTTTTTTVVVTTTTTPAGPNRPAAPRLRGVNATARGKVSLSWAAPRQVAGYPLTAFVITLAATDGSTIVRTAGPVAQSLVITGLSDSTTYAVSIAARNSDGIGPSTPSRAVQTWGPPSAPRIRSASSAQSQLTIAWVAPQSTGGPQLTGYVLTATPVAGGAAVVANAASTSLTYTFPRLTAGTTYRVTVSAMNPIGTGPGAKPVQFYVE